MKITEAKLTKRFKTGEYEHEEYALSADVESKSGAAALQYLREQILEAFSGEVTSTKEEKPKAAKKAAKKEEKKNAKQANPVNDEESDDEATSSEDSGDADEGAENDEATDSKDRDDSDDSADDGESDEADSEEAKPAKSSKASSSKPSAEKGKKSFKKKPQAYDRSIEQHKDIFSGVVRSVSPDWKKSDELKARAKKSSEEMEGENFLDENGEVYPTFRTMVARLMKGKTK